MCPAKSSRDFDLSYIQSNISFSWIRIKYSTKLSNKRQNKAELSNKRKKAQQPYYEWKMNMILSIVFILTNPIKVFEMLY